MTSLDVPKDSPIAINNANPILEPFSWFQPDAVVVFPLSVPGATEFSTILLISPQALEGLEDPSAP